MENNELIARFIGNKRLSYTHVYHASWNALMPVVRKIIPPHGQELSGIKYQTGVVNALQTADIDKVYEAVIEFIKWHTNKIAK